MRGERFAIYCFNEEKMLFAPLRYSEGTGQTIGKLLHLGAWVQKTIADNGGAMPNTLDVPSDFKPKVLSYTKLKEIDPEKSIDGCADNLFVVLMPGYIPRSLDYLQLGIEARYTEYMRSNNIFPVHNQNTEVRSRVLREDMTFTQQEKQTVQQQHYHFGNVSGSQIQIGSNSSNQTQTQTGGDMVALSALIELLRDAIQQGHIETEVRDELQAELATLQAQAGSPKPKWAIIKATAGSIKAILENGAGSVLAAQALPYLTALL